MKPETVGMSSARLTRLDDLMKRRYVDGGYLPGMLTNVYRKGHLVHTGICGHIDIERDKKMREDAIFRIYSMSKPITAVALMMLVEEGLIGLDDAVHSHIPAWKDLAVYASGMPSLLANAPPSFMTTPVQRPMKVVDLATHTSGLTYGFMMRTAVDAAYRKAKVTDRQTPGGLQGMVDQLAQIPLDFSPGTAWNYSVSIDVLGYLVEKLSGMSFGEFLRTRLFEPLGMNDTAFYVPSDKTERFTSCYQPETSGSGLKLQDDARESTCRAVQPELPARRQGGRRHGAARDVQRIRLCRGGLFARLRGQRRRGQNPPAWLAWRILLGRRCRDGFLDRPQGRADRRLHDPGDRQRGAPDAAPGLAHTGLRGDHGVVRLIAVLSDFQHRRRCRGDHGPPRSGERQPLLRRC